MQIDKFFVENLIESIVHEITLYHYIYRLKMMTILAKADFCIAAVNELWNTLQIIIKK